MLPRLVVSLEKVIKALDMTTYTAFKFKVQSFFLAFHNQANLL